VIALIRKSRDPDEAKWGLMHVLSPTLHEHPTFAELPRLDFAQARLKLADLLTRVQAEEPSYTELSRKYEGDGFSEEQAKNILDMRLQRLTGLQREELFKELIALLREIASLKDILGNVSTLMRVIKGELEEVRQKFGDERRTEITGELDAFTNEDLIAEED